MSLAAVDLVTNISSQYPLIYDFLLLLCAFIGFVMCGWVLVTLIQVKVFQTVSEQQFNMGLAIPALMFGSALMALPYSMFLMGGTLLDGGYGSLFPPEAVTGSADGGAKQLLGMFAEQTCRIIGWVMGAWGMMGAFGSRMPNGKREELWPGIIRIGLGTLLILARDFSNLFGGMGDVVFG